MKRVLVPTVAAAAAVPSSWRSCERERGRHARRSTTAPGHLNGAGRFTHRRACVTGAARSPTVRATRPATSSRSRTTLRQRETRTAKSAATRVPASSTVARQVPGMHRTTFRRQVRITWLKGRYRTTRPAARLAVTGGTGKCSERQRLRLDLKFRNPVQVLEFDFIFHLIGLAPREKALRRRVGAWSAHRRLQQNARTGAGWATLIKLLRRGRQTAWRRLPSRRHSWLLPRMRQSVTGWRCSIPGNLDRGSGDTAAGFLNP